MVSRFLTHGLIMGHMKRSNEALSYTCSLDISAMRHCHVIVSTPVPNDIYQTSVYPPNQHRRLAYNNSQRSPDLIYLPVASRMMLLRSMLM